MRLLNEMPELESEVATGKLNLTHLGLAQGLFKREKKSGREFSLETKSKVLTEIAGLSTREAQKVVFSFATETESRPGRISRVSAEKIHLSFEVSEKTKAKLDQICDIALKETDPARKGARQVTLEMREGDQVTKPNRGAAEPDSKSTPKPSQTEVRRQVWRRDQERCTAE